MNQSDMIGREMARLYAENRNLKRSVVLLLVAGTVTWLCQFAA